MTFYNEMAQMAEDLLAPANAGGLGQGTVVLIRESVVVNEDEPWEPPMVISRSETLRASVLAVDQDAGSASFSDGSTILVGDLIVTASVPKTINWILGGDDQAALYVVIDGGRKLPVIQSSTIPAAGTPVVIKLYVRGAS